ncbi:hypothetical protein RW1_035_01150 [Rhodococcus wratislaviensis NBRC 100605]|uniref:Uncharacterized protein n=1 Tax=Rhodococcus wratislaviensis NBRC 100605 TaxID=1219028 RepID=X0PUV5_RHOWR|nr:hypothetical protein RW1_035_01150 [Rhodococcus wratislaviensis NBRC 100605]
MLSGILLGDVIGNYGVAQACIGTVKACGWTPADTTVAIQGIGTMGAARPGIWTRRSANGPTDPAGAFKTASLRRVLIIPVVCLERAGVWRARSLGAVRVAGSGSGYEFEPGADPAL